MHFAIFGAFDRKEEHLYEYQIGGNGPHDPKAVRYSTLDSLENSEPLHILRNDATVTTINSLNLKADDVFGYWFDFGDDWWHQINVVSIQNRAATGGYPKVVERVAESPPQYL